VNPRVIIQAAGKSSRWKSDIPKHFVPINGTTLLQNTTDKLLKYTNDIIIIGNDESYQIKGTKLYIPEKRHPEWYDLEVFKVTEPLWSDKHTIIMAGDAYYTEEALQITFQPTSTWRWTLRATPSTKTGKPYKETFALSIHPSQYSLIKSHIDRLIRLTATNYSNWRLLSRLINLTHEEGIALIYDLSYDQIVQKIIEHPNVAHIDDMTDDFDSIEDYLIWLKRQANSNVP
jgi:hypothetical protein